MGDFLAALRQRHIWRIVVAYAVVAWVLLQVFNNLTPVLKVPEWTGTMLLVVLVVGFPIALLLGWAVEVRAASGAVLALSPEKPPPTPKAADTVAKRAGVADPAATVALPEMNAPTAALPDCPSLVVLPFANMSGEADQEFFADGLTEDIITELSRFRHLFIISRNSAFTYKGKAVDVKQVARELNVQYVVEGSVRKHGDRVRVTVQLIDGRADRHIWAERYDRQLEDIFALQDDMTSAIVATLPGRMEHAAGEQVGRKPTENMTAYECVLAGKRLHHRSTAEDNAKALELLNRAIALDPQYAHAHAWKACTLGQAWVHRFPPDPSAAFMEAMQELQIALRLDNNDSDVHRILAAVYLSGGQHDKAMAHQQRALALNPNDDLIVVQQGEVLTWMGQAEEGIAWIQKAMRLNPCHPERFWNHLGRAYFVARRYQKAIAAYSHIGAPDTGHHAFLAACYAQAGDEAMARRHANEILKMDPGFSVESFLRTLHYARDEDVEHHRAALVKAGLPLAPASAGATPAQPPNMSCE